MHTLDFEDKIISLEKKIDELRHLSDQDGIDIVKDVASLESKRDQLLGAVYKKLTPWQKVQVARHPERPHFLSYVSALVDDFVPLAGDRLYAEDEAIVGGLGSFKGRTVMVIGQEKGHDIETRMRHNFGMPRPEGYRKAQRLMKMADHFSVPILSFIDTAGAYPGADAEARGQAEAIARSMEVSFGLRVPMIATVIGEGGSGGAVAIATANKVLMLEHAIYSVITPEGCASILWRSADMKEKAAEAQKLTAQDLFKLKIIDEIVLEPLGGAHREPRVVMENLGKALDKNLTALERMTPDEIYHQRQNKFLNIGRDLK